MYLQCDICTYICHEVAMDPMPMTLNLSPILKIAIGLLALAKKLMSFHSFSLRY